jgi:hypothetical protein
MASSYNIKTLRAEIQLGTGNFQGTSKNTYTIEGLAMSAKIEKVGLPDLNKCALSITGMKYDVMEQLTVLGFRKLTSAKNLLTLYGGTQGETLPVLFSGDITKAVADFKNAPDVVFQINATTGAYSVKKAAPPLSIQGDAAAADLAQRWAAEMGYSFKNAGVVTRVNNCVFNGSPMQKLRMLAEQYHIDTIIDDGEVIIQPRGTVRKTGTIPYLTEQSGLFGYPAFTDKGIQLVALYNPDFKRGGLIRVKSIVPRASGEWKIVKLTHSVSAYSKNAEWFSEIEATWKGE